jgi:homoserine O-acetyltransferase
MIRVLISLSLILGLAGAAAAQPAPPPPDLPPGTPPVQEGDFIAKGFRFHTGEVMPELRLHYRTLGAPHRNPAGQVDNAVLVLHGTGGAGDTFIRPQFSGELFGPGQLLDATRYYIILPDDIGHGKSSKPSDGLRMRFPKYDYEDMVQAEHALVTQGLGVDHLRLIMGTSMGCMHAFVWGEDWPRAMDALMPLACLPVAIAGRNRLWRKMSIDVIEHDPTWENGDYKTEPLEGLRGAEDITVIAGSAPQQMQKALPTRADSEKYLDDHMAKYLPQLDADDSIYQLDSSRDYDPSPKLETITAPVMWVNSADDFINPPELMIAEQEVSRMPKARFILLPIGPNTHGHGTHTWAIAWKQYLVDLLTESEP